MTFTVALASMPVSAADATGVYSLVDGDARALRGTTWFRLVAGTRVLEGDVIDVSEHGQIQLELKDGGTLNAQGPALMYAMAIPLVDGKPGAVAELIVQHGWLKAAAKGPRPLRVRMAMMTVTLGDAVVVARCDARRAEVFVESGTANVASSRGKESPQNVAGGEFITRNDDRQPTVASRPPPAFLAALPRQFRDPLPALASRFSAVPEALVKVSEVSFAEAEPWLAGTTRKAFVRRLSPRLSDPAFRAAYDYPTEES